MSRAAGPISRVERYARRFAAAVAKNRMPAVTPEFEDYLGRFPEDVFVTLDGFVAQATAGKIDDPLAVGHLVLMQRQLECIRFRVDRGYDDAIRLVEIFQHTASDLALTGRIDGHALSMVASALHQAGIAASAELTAALSHCADDLVPDADDPVADDGAPAAAKAPFDELAAQCGGDPFAVASLLAETGHGMPAPVRGAMAAELAESADAVVREAAVLQLFDAEPTVRQAAAAALQARIGGLSPASLRRLIAMRNWSPEAERHRVDALIHAARARRIDCASWQVGSVETLLASCIDGSGAQGFVLVSPAGKRKRLSSVLLKNGVRDAWTAPPQTGRSLQSTLDRAATEAEMMPVSRDYLDRTLRHHLQLTLAAGAVPPAGLLQVAETIGGGHWPPALQDWRETLAGLVGELPASMLKPEAVNAALKSSADWADIGSIVESWFEDDQEVARLVGGVRGRPRPKMTEYVLRSAIAPRREAWAERFLWTAMWLREGPDGIGLPWRQFVILARALADGRDLSDISLMRAIAAQTVAALAQG